MLLKKIKCVMSDDDVRYLKVGDVVTLCCNILYSPTMIVLDRVFKDGDKANGLLGLKCCWFTEDYVYQEGVFNTKLLKLYE